MKKLISIFVALTLVMAMLASIPFTGIFSADSANTEYVIDFEGAQGSAFYGTDNTNRITMTDMVDIGTAENHGNVMSITKLMVYRDDNYVNNTSNNAVKWNTIYYPTAFRLPNADGSGTVYLEKDSQFTVTFEMKKNAAIDNTYFTSITAALVFADSYECGDLTGNVRDWVNNRQTVTLAVTDLQADSDWVKYTADITVPKSGYAAFMLYGTNFANSCDIEVDNIKITPTVISDKNIIDFEGAQATYLGVEANRIGYINQMDLGIAEGQGNVMHFNTLKVYRKGYDHWNTVKSPTAFRLVNNNGSQTLSFEKDEQYTVTFKMKKNSDIVTSDFTNITAALVFESSYSYQGGNIREWVDGGKTAVLTTVDLKADEKWITYTADITVPSSGYGAFLLYGSGNDQKAWYASCDIDVDDISVAPTDYSSDKIDFENEQGTFYSSNANRVCHADTADIKKTDDHGNVMHLSDLKVYRNDGYYNKWNTIYYPSAFRLPTLDGKETLYLEKDAKYTVSFQMKKNAEISNEFFSQITAALVFADSYALGDDNTNIRDWVNNGQTATIAVIDLSADSDWVTYAANITVPKSGYVAFLLYGTNWRTACDIDIDNISVVEHTEDIMTTVVCHNFDNNGGDKELTVNFVDSFNEIERPFSETAKFDGWYLDEALTKPALGSVGETKELWIKWRTELDGTVNTYDEENVVYETVMGNEEDGSDAMVDRIVNGTETQNGFAQYGVFVTKRESATETNLTNAANFTSIRKLEWNWPAIVKIYDSEDENSGLFIPEKNTAYKISFKYRSNVQPSRASLMIQLRGTSTTGSTFYDKGNVYVSNFATLSYATSGWQTAESTFFTDDVVTPLFLTVIASSASVYTEADVWIDDIVIEEIYSTPAIYFDTMGGSIMNPQTCVAGNTIPEAAVPTKDGYLFDGWFTDSEYTEPFTLSKMPAENIKLYAKWAKKAETPYTLKQDFDTCDYINDGTAANIPDNTNSDELTWIGDSKSSYSGNGYISVATSNYDDEYTQSLPAVSFKDENGESYQVVKGGRYRLTVAARGNDITNNLFFVTTQQVPTFGINVNNTVPVINFQTASDYTGLTAGEWGTYEVFFIAEETGKLYLIFYNGGLGSMDIDSLTVEPVGEDVATTVEYWDEAGTTLIASRFGKVGSLLADASISNKEGYVFNGWRTAEGTLHTSAFFPEKDTVLYASYREAEDLTNATSKVSEGSLNIDFEDPEAAKIFYGTANNSSEPFTGVIYVTGDKENARSGDSYLRLNKIGIWNEQWYRKVKFFDPDSVGNQIYLDPLSVYRVSFWANVDVAGTSLIRVATFDQRDSLSTYTTHYQHMLQDAEMIDTLGKWVKYEADVVVGNDPVSLGIVLSGGYLTAAIDDITVQKLWDVTVSFESNGGSQVEPIVALAYDCIVEPGYPIKEGYTFMGWYADKELTEVFKFAKTPVTENITLYAKWEKAFVPQTLFRNETTYTDVVTEIENIPEDAHLDGKITVVDNDKIGAASAAEEESFPWWILILIGAVLAALIVVIIIIIILKRRKKKD